MSELDDLEAFAARFAAPRRAGATRKRHLADEAWAYRTILAKQKATRSLRFKANVSRAKRKSAPVTLAKVNLP